MSIGPIAVAARMAAALSSLLRLPMPISAVAMASRTHISSS